jgi:hypothetical protein
MSAALGESISRSQDISQQIRTEIEATRQDYHDLLAEISEKDFNKPSLNPEWTIGEMLYHMSLAPRGLPMDVFLIRHLKWVPKLPAGPFDRLNIYFTRRGAKNATKKSLAETYDKAHAGTLKALESVRDDEWSLGVEYPDWDPLLSGFVTLERLFHYIKRHFDSHEKDIRQALGMEMEPVSPDQPNG